MAERRFTMINAELFNLKGLAVAIALQLFGKRHFFKILAKKSDSKLRATFFKYYSPLNGRRAIILALLIA